MKRRRKVGGYSKSEMFMVSLDKIFDMEPLLRSDQMVGSYCPEIMKGMNVRTHEQMLTVIQSIASRSIYK
jgi:hypothetical protein